MSRDTMDVADWAEVRYSKNEIPLVYIVNSIRENRKTFTLRKSKQYPSSWMLWDVSSDEVVVATHAFVMRFCSPLETGNFVPDRESMPEGLVEYMRKSEPSGLAQISLTFDTRMDKNLQPSLAILEDWAERTPGFDTRRRKRNPWMSPTYVMNQSKYTVTSQLFQAKTAFNSKANTYSVPYEVHPWIRDACIPHNPSWIPNPGRVQFFDGQEGNMDDLLKSKDPILRAGDLIKLTFKIVFTIGREMWNMQFVPIQAIRVGQIDTSGGAYHIEDHKLIILPKLGDRLTPIKGPRSYGKATDNSSRGGNDIRQERKRIRSPDGSERSDSEPVTDWPKSEDEYPKKKTARLEGTEDVVDEKDARSVNSKKEEPGDNSDIADSMSQPTGESVGDRASEIKKDILDDEDELEKQKKRRTGRARGTRTH